MSAAARVNTSGVSHGAITDGSPLIEPTLFKAPTRMSVPDAYLSSGSTSSIKQETRYSFDPRSVLFFGCAYSPQGTGSTMLPKDVLKHNGLHHGHLIEGRHYTFGSDAGALVAAKGHFEAAERVGH